MARRKKILANLPAILIIVILSLFFFHKLFYPISSLFVNPDFGQSDIWQFNLPLKFFLSESLKNNTLPLWSKNIGMGFPVLAEGQIGTFNLANLLFFKFLPFVTAFNLSYVFLFIFCGLGTYLYLRKLSIAKSVSLFSALSFSYSAVFVTHIQHPNLLQTASFLPWLFFFSERILQEKKLINYIGLSIIISQQIFSGFPQLTFISLLAVCGYFIYRNKSHQFILNLSIFILFILLGFGLSAIQLAPQWEFLKVSTRSAGLTLKETIYYSFPLKNLLTFISPRALGTPENGSYPFFSQADGSIFWENNGFMGLLPIIGFFLGFFLVRKNKTLVFYYLLALTSFLLMLGKYSPFYIIYIFPPFSYFRVPARFILPLVWSIICISALTLNFFYNAFKNQKLGLLSKGLISLLMVASLIHLLNFGYPYNPVYDAKKVLEPPQTAQFLKKEEISGRIYSVDDGQNWNGVFTKTGWKEISPYLYFRNNLRANFNLLFGLNSSLVYAGFTPSRYNFYRALADFPFGKDEAAITLEENDLKLLSIGGIQYLISPVKINASSLKEVYGAKPQGKNLPEYTIYENKNNLPRFYLANSAKQVQTINDLQQLFTQDKFNPQTQVFSENNLQLLSSPKEIDYTFKLISDDDQSITLGVTNDQKGIFVLKDSYYPGWKAYVDDGEKEIFPVNINSRGIVIDPGNHQITFVYQPTSFLTGKIITGASVLFISLIIALKILRKRLLFLDRSLGI